MTEQHVRPLLYQGRLNLLDQSLKTDGILDELNRQHLGLVVFSPLAQGLLTDRYLNGIPSDSRMRTDVTLKESLLTPQLLEKLATWNAEARDLGLTLSQYSLRWVLNHPGVTSVIVGVSKKEQLLENLQVIHKL